MTIRTDYTFLPDTSTITFAQGVLQEKIQRIINISRGVEIYNVNAMRGSLSTIDANSINYLYMGRLPMASIDKLRIEYND